ncbi:hypothetical protein C8R45DRAFT_927885 [Mycena sanguinolenta]|nr:hypothetical protein C8R45DRAFT_927885 [Mycena sanguinolenta]
MNVQLGLDLHTRKYVAKIFIHRAKHDAHTLHTCNTIPPHGIAQMRSPELERHCTAESSCVCTKRRAATMPPGKYGVLKAAKELVRSSMKKVGHGGDKMSRLNQIVCRETPATSDKAMYPKGRGFVSLVDKIRAGIRWRSAGTVAVESENPYRAPDCVTRKRIVAAKTEKGKGKRTRQAPTTSVQTHTHSFSVASITGWQPVDTPITAFVHRVSEDHRRNYHDEIQLEPPSPVKRAPLAGPSNAVVAPIPFHNPPDAHVTTDRYQLVWDDLGTGDDHGMDVEEPKIVKPGDASFGSCAYNPIL